MVNKRLFFVKRPNFSLFKFPQETAYQFKEIAGYDKTKFNSRDDYYYIFGLKFLTKKTFYRDKNGKLICTERKFLPQYKGLDLNDREKVAQIYIDKYGLFPSKEYIPFEKWADHDSLQGQSLNIINHPVFQYAEQFILSDFKREKDVLVVASCSDSKPYDKNPNYNLLKRTLKGRADFVILSDPGVIPLKFSYYYPFLHYNWNHCLETKELAEAFIYYSILRLERFVKKFGYKKVILIAPNGGVYEEIYNRINGGKSADGKDKNFYPFEMRFVYDSNLWEEQIHYYNGYRGMAKLRIFVSPVGMGRLNELLEDWK